MEIIEEKSTIYERTLDDVKQMIKHSKLNGKNLTGLTQAIYYPTKDEDNLKLLELNSDLLEHIQEGHTLYFKGGLNEKIVLCTDSKTYDVKAAEISNSLLLVPDLKFGQATSKSPLRNKKTGSINNSLDSSLEDDIDAESTIERKLEKRCVSSIFYEYLECRLINPKFNKLDELLKLTRYSGPENEQFINNSFLFTHQQLLDTIQCSQEEFKIGLKHLRSIELDGHLRVLDYQYEYRVISLMLALISENSWKLNEINRHETLTALQDIVSLEILIGLFDLYTKPNDSDENYEYCEDLVCRIIAQNILQQGLKFHIDDFMNTWHDALPEGMNINESYLKGIGIIDTDSNPPCVRSLNESNLPQNIYERLKILFKTKSKWTLEAIEPYVCNFTTPQLSVTSILAKYARSLTVKGQRIYVSKY